GVLLLGAAKVPAADRELLDILLENGAISATQHAQLLEQAETDAAAIEAAVAASAAPRAANWTDRISLRGYLQVRHSSLLGGDRGINLWSDRSVGDASSLGDADKNL